MLPLGIQSLSILKLFFQKPILIMTQSAIDWAPAECQPTEPPVEERSYYRLHVYNSWRAVTHSTVMNRDISHFAGKEHRCRGWVVVPGIAKKVSGRDRDFNLKCKKHFPFFFKFSVFTNLFRNIFEFLLCVKSCSMHWGCSSDKRQDMCSRGMDKLWREGCKNTS